MVQEMAYDWKSWWTYLKSSDYYVTKCGISRLFVCLAFRILYGGFSPFSDYRFMGKTNFTSIHSQESKKQVPVKGVKIAGGKCDLFTGDWIPYMKGPSYTNNSCYLIDDYQNCMRNGRPDLDYLYWRWKPRGCDLPIFDASRFLRIMKNKSWAFIGDSISGNHAISLLCILSTVETPVYRDKLFKNRKCFFPSYNLSVSVVWSPFLAKLISFEDNKAKLHLDKLDDRWTGQYSKHDYMIISFGKWFGKTAVYFENDSVVGCHNSTRNCTELRFDYAYRKILKRVFDHILNSNHKGKILYRTFTPNHFENGEWFTGGTCKRTLPTKEGEFELSEFDRILRSAELEELENVTLKASENGIDLKIFDVHPLSLMRPDGHPGPYRFFQPFAKDKDAKVDNDCLHWCVPGPIDSWNDLLMGMAVNG